MANKHVILQIMSSDLSLYHYTKCKGVQGIIKEGSFQATRSDFLNDTNEMRYILYVVREVLHEIENADWQRLLLEQFAETACEIKKHFHYVVSFSAEPDGITLWAEFGESTGYNLEFQSGELLERIKQFRKVPYHGYVIYSEKEQRRIIRDLLLNRIPQTFGGSFEDIMEMAVHDKECIQFQKFCKSFQKAITIYALFFKQQEFAAEREYRLIFKEHSEKEVMFREKEGFLQPYILVNLMGKKDKLPIQSITVAPKNHVDLAKEGMRQYLKHMGYDVEVRLSRIKLRY